MVTHYKKDKRYEEKENTVMQGFKCEQQNYVPLYETWLIIDQDSLLFH